jgi:hypothetical protein
MFADIHKLMVSLGEEESFGALSILQGHFEFSCDGLSDAFLVDFAAEDITSEQANVEAVPPEAQTLHFKF